MAMLFLRLLTVGSAFLVASSDDPCVGHRCDTDACPCGCECGNPTDPGLCYVPKPPTVAAAAGAGDATAGRCAFEHRSGRQAGVRCHGISFDLSVPPRCIDAASNTSCGVVVDVHGLTMNATWEEALTELSVHSARRDLITLQPTAEAGCVPPACSWSGGGADCAAKVIGPRTRESSCFPPPIGPTRRGATALPAFGGPAVS